MHHGVALNGDAWMDWQPNLLAAGHRVIRLDMRGFGRSEPTPENYGWSLPGFFANLEAVLASENVEAFHFVGESIGGFDWLGLRRAQSGPIAIGCIAFHAVRWASRPGRGPLARDYRYPGHDWMGG